MRLVQVGIVAALLAGSAATQTKSAGRDPGPLVLKSQGSFFVGGDSKTVTQPGFGPNAPPISGEITVRGLVSIEMPCVTNLTTAQIGTLAKIPTLVMFGDHLTDIQGGGPANWGEAFASCNTFLEQLKKAGGDAEMMHLPATRHSWQQSHADAG